MKSTPGAEGSFVLLGHRHFMIAAMIMLLNLIFMLMTRHILALLSVVLPILNAVLGIVQVAPGLQIINNSLRALGLT